MSFSFSSFLSCFSFCFLLLSSTFLPCLSSLPLFCSFLSLSSFLYLSFLPPSLPSFLSLSFPLNLTTLVKSTHECMHSTYSFTTCFSKTCLSACGLLGQGHASLLLQVIEATDFYALTCLPRALPWKTQLRSACVSRCLLVLSWAPWGKAFGGRKLTLG